MEDDNSRPQGGQRDIQATAGRCGLQLLGEMLQVSLRGVPEEFEEVIMETVCMGAVDDEVRDGKHLEQETGSLALFGAVPKQPLGIDDHYFMNGVKCCPHTHRAGLLCGRGLEHFSAHEERVVQGVRFALSCVTKDGHHLQQLVRYAVQPLYKCSFIFYLGKNKKSSYGIKSYQNNKFRSLSKSVTFAQLTCISSFSSTRRKLDIFSRSFAL